MFWVLTRRRPEGGSQEHQQPPERNQRACRRGGCDTAAAAAGGCFSRAAARRATRRDRPDFRDEGVGGTAKDRLERVSGGEVVRLSQAGDVDIAGTIDRDRPSQIDGPPTKVRGEDDRRTARVKLGDEGIVIASKRRDRIDRRKIRQRGIPRDISIARAVGGDAGPQSSTGSNSAPAPRYGVETTRG